MTSTLQAKAFNYPEARMNHNKIYEQAETGDCSSADILRRAKGAWQVGLASNGTCLPIPDTQYVSTLARERQHQH